MLYKRNTYPEDAVIRIEKYCALSLSFSNGKKLSTTERYVRPLSLDCMRKYVILIRLVMNHVVFVLKIYGVYTIDIL